MNTAILITARLKSTRLPKKVIRTLQGRPMLEHMLDRLKLAKKPSQIIICTSPLIEDDPLMRIAEEQHVHLFRGDPDDVLLRLKDAASEFNIDIIINCTADNPFVDPFYIDKLVDFHVNGDYDYSKSAGLPFGTFAYAISYPALVRACELKAEKDTEVWGGYFSETGQFFCGNMTVLDPAVKWPELRLTVDTPEDFEFIRHIFDELYIPGKVFSLQEIVSFCRERPGLVAINTHVTQKQARAIRIKPTIDQEGNYV